MRMASNENTTPEQDKAAATVDKYSAPEPTQRSTATTTQQQVRTRRRKGSLRKVALLGRGAQRDRRDASPLTIEVPDRAQTYFHSTQSTPKVAVRDDPYGVDLSDLTPRPSMDGFASRTSLTNSSVSSTNSGDVRDRETSTLYNSTTDEEDLPQLPLASSSLRSGLPLPPAPSSYFGDISPIQQRRPSFHQAKSPLSYSGLASTPLQPPDSDWDYSETEWWGWLVLSVTWFVFVIGMGSCFGIWSWAWDVGTTPYAPPELEDDETLPIVGYYPALIILTGVMAWVWVVVAWVGMKYFRHAKISGD